MEGQRVEAITQPVSCKDQVYLHTRRLECVRLLVFYAEREREREREWGGGGGGDRKSPYPLLLFLGGVSVTRRGRGSKKGKGWTKGPGLIVHRAYKV